MPASPDAEPIKLRDLIQSLASTVVVTSKYLDQANVDLHNIYASAASETLAAMTPPRFALDEFSIDLTLVVAQAKVVGPDRAPSEPTPAVTLSAAQAKQISDLLAAARDKEAQTLQNQVKAARSAVTAKGAEVASIQTRIRSLDSQIAATRKKLAGLSPLSPLRVSLTNTLKALQTQRSQASADLTRAGQELAQKQAALAQLERQVPFDPLAAWQAFVESYTQLKALHQEAVELFGQNRALPRIQIPATLPSSVTTTIAKSNLAAPTKAKATELLQDFSSTSSALSALTRLVVDLQGEGIRVLVDAESLAKAPETTRQRIHLTFRTESQQTVDVDGRKVDISK